MSRTDSGTFRFHVFLMACLVFFMVAEAAFRLLLPVSDIPYWKTDAFLGYRHRPRLSGRFVSREFNAGFRLNNRGWNSADDYTKKREPGVPRIAIVGDSYVEGLQVAQSEGVGHVLSELLGRNGRRVQVYSYGISAASTAYAHDLLQAEVLGDRPDCIIYLFIDNDVRDSVSFLGSPQEWGPVYDLDEKGSLRRLPPRLYRPRIVSRWLSRSALFRYFWINCGLGTLWQSGPPWERSAALKSEGSRQARETSSPKWERAWEITGLLIGEMNLAARGADADFLVVDRPDSTKFYPIDDPGDVVLDHRRLGDLAAAHGFRYVDLSPYFARDWMQHHQRFEFERDYHWNRHGHEVAARALSEILTKLHPRLFLGAEEKVPDTSR